MDDQLVQRNAGSRARLRALIDRHSDEELGRSLENGWTVSATLAHLAFWDRRVAILLRRAQGGDLTPSPADFDLVNDALKPTWLALPPRAAADECLAAAEEADAAVAGLPTDLAQTLAGGAGVRLDRSRHRSDHLREIEAALS